MLDDVVSQSPTGGQASAIVEFEVDATVDATAACFVSGLREAGESACHDLTAGQRSLSEAAVTIHLCRELNVRSEERS